MLRGYSRHDGISNKQSAKERDRDRQRERQRQERALMLPNDDKDISTGAQDLFHAPVKVEPSVEDRTTLEIRNTLGNFEHVKHYVVDGASRNLIGVDQNSNPSHRQRSSRQSGSSGSNSSKIPSSHRNYSPLPNPSNTSSTSQNNLKASNVIQKVPHTTQNQHHSSQLGGGGVNTSSNNCSSIVPPTQFSGKKSNNLSSTTSSSSSSLPYTNNCNSATEVGGLSVTTTLNNNGNSVGGSSLSASDNFSAEIVNEIKTERGSHSKKPALERVDSQLELESMIKEMMDVTPPITAIQTPAKESPAKKYTPRRASKSEEKIVLIREGMTNIPPPLKKMDTSESSSTDTESSSDSEDSSSGSQGGAENQETTISKPPPTTNSPTRWNLSSFIRKDNIKGTPDSTSGTATTIKSPKDSKSRENPHTSNAIDSEESPGEVSIKLESNVTSTSVFGKSMSSSPAENTSVASKTGSKSSNIPHVSQLEFNEGPYSKVLGKSPRKAADVKADPFLPIKVPTTIPMKGSSASSSVASKIASLSATSSEDEEEEKPKEVISRSIPQEKPRVGGKQGTRKRPRHSSSSERPGIKSDDDDSSPEVDRTSKKKVQDRNKSATITKLFRPPKKKRIDSPNRESEDSKGITNSTRGKGSKSKPSPSNRVPAKDTGRKCNTTTAVTTNSNNNSSSLVHNNNSSSLVHNGDLDSKVKVKSSSSSTGKKRRESSSKGASSSHSSHHHSRKHGKSHSSRDSHKSSNNNNEEGDLVSINPPSATMVNIVTPSSAVNLSRVKEEAGSGKSHPPSTLMCRIPLFKLPRPPGTITTTSTNSAITTSANSAIITSANSAIIIKSEKDSDKGGGDQDTYLEEAKRLKHKADNEKLGTTQASMYLEAGLYFILTGISMERDRAVGQQAAFTMYKDTLSLIRYIGTRFRSGRTDYSNVTEAKIIVLSMRCQSLLSLKLFKIKMRETKDVVQYLTEHFSKAPVDVAPIPNSPQLIMRSPTSSTHTSSPHSPTSSPAGSSGIRPWEQQAPSSAGSGQWGGGHTPSPHHPHQNHHVVSVPRSIYSQMYKQCVSTMNLISAHELWETADTMVERYHMEEFFASIDRQCGPLTLHNSLVDLVNYVKHGLKLLKIDDS